MIDPAQADTHPLSRGVPADCNFHTGYLGRVGVFEVLPVDSSIRQAILAGKSASELRAMATSQGMATLEQAAAKKVLAGQTTVEEMHRVLIMD